MYYTVSTYVEKTGPGNFLSYANLRTMGPQKRLATYEQTDSRYGLADTHRLDALITVTSTTTFLPLNLVLTKIYMSYFLKQHDLYSTKPHNPH